MACAREAKKARRQAEKVQKEAEKEKEHCRKESQRLRERDAKKQKQEAEKALKKMACLHKAAEAAAAKQKRVDALAKKRLVLCLIRRSNVEPKVVYTSLSLLLSYT